jgi:hypothetical protein
VHVINNINIPKQERVNIINNHKLGKEDICGKGLKDYNYSSGKSPTCRKDVGNNTYNCGDYGESPLRHYHI